MTTATPVLPYPKPTNEFPIQTRINVYKEDPNFSNVEYQKKNIEFYYTPNERLFSYACLRKKYATVKPRELSYYVVYDKTGNKIGEFNSLSEILQNFPELK